MSIMNKYIQSKSTSIRHNLLWSSISLKRIIKKKKKINKAKQSHKRIRAYLGMSQVTPSMKYIDCKLKIYHITRLFKSF